VIFILFISSLQIIFYSSQKGHFSGTRGVEIPSGAFLKREMIFQFRTRAKSSLERVRTENS